jgi:hypothetical protein
MKKIRKVLFILVFFWASGIYAQTITIGSVYDGLPNVDAAVRTGNDYNDQKVGGIFGVVGMLASHDKIAKKNDAISLQIHEILAKNNAQFMQLWSELSTKSLNSEINLFTVEKNYTNERFYFLINEDIDFKKSFLEDHKVMVRFVTFVRLVDTENKKEIFNSRIEYNGIAKTDTNNFLKNDRFLQDIRHQSLVNASHSLYSELRKSNALFYMANAYSKKDVFIDYKKLVKEASSYFSIKPFTPKNWKIKQVNNFVYAGFPSKHKNYISLQTEVSPDYWLPEKTNEQQLVVQADVMLSYIRSRLGNEWISQEEEPNQEAPDGFSRFCFINTDKTAKKIYYVKSINGFVIMHKIESSGNYEMFLKYYETDITHYVINSTFKTK